MSNIAPECVGVLASPPVIPFAIIPVEVIREQGISDAAFRLYAALDGRITETKSLRLRQDTLAADLGWSVSKVKRGMAELLNVGLVESNRTSRSSRIKVQNPVRRPVDNLPSDSSNLTPQDTRSVNSDPADRSDLTPPQINNSLINNNNSDVGQIPTPTATGFSKENPIGGYLEAIAEAGVTLEATKKVQHYLGKIKTQGVSPQELTELVSRYLATGENISDAARYAAGYILPELAEGRRPPVIKSAPKQMTPTELANAVRCDHGAVIGQCALCRSTDVAADRVKQIVFDVAPTKTEFDYNNLAEDFNDVMGQEISFLYCNAFFWVDLDKPGGELIKRFTMTPGANDGIKPLGADPDLGHSLNVCEWKHRIDERYSPTEVRHNRTGHESLFLEYVKPIDFATFATDLKWIFEQVDAIVQQASTPWEELATIVPRNWDIVPNGNMAEIMQNGETVAHISVKDTEQILWDNTESMTLFTEYNELFISTEDVHEIVKKSFEDFYAWYYEINYISIENLIKEVVVHGGEVAIIVESDKRDLTYAETFGVFQALITINRELAKLDPFLSSLSKTA